MAYGFTRSVRNWALAGAALALPGAALAQDAGGDMADPTDNLPAVESASLVDAAKTCVAARGQTGFDAARFTQGGWNAQQVAEGDDAPVPVTFLRRDAGDPLVILPPSESGQAVCVSMGVVTAGAAGEAPIKAAFDQAFGTAKSTGEQSLYQQGANMIALNFENDDDQGLVVMTAVIQPGE